MTSGPRFRNGKQLAAGEGVAFVPDGEPGGTIYRVDKPLDRPARPCSRCSKPFQPTLRRRMLCAHCAAYANDTGGNPFEPDSECGAGELSPIQTW